MVICLEKIGSILKQRRIEQNLTIQQIHEKTKLSTTQLEAIERGDIAFFKEDLSYLSYFVRYYANALGINYDDLREDMDHTISEFTSSLTLSQIQKQEALTNNIKQKTKSESKKHYTSTVIKPKKRIVDFKTFGLIILAIAIVGSIIYVSITQLPKLLANDPIQRPPLVVPGDKDPGDESGGNETETPDTEEPGENVPSETLTITAIDSTTFEVRGIKVDEPIALKVTFNNDSWTSFSEDNTKLSEPKEATYRANSEATINTTMKDEKLLSIRFGRLNGNTVTINGQTVTFSDETAQMIVTTLNFKFVLGSDAE